MRPPGRPRRFRRYRVSARGELDRRLGFAKALDRVGLAGVPAAGGELGGKVPA